MLGFAMRFSGPAQLGRYAGPSLELSFEGDTYAMGDIGSAPQNKAYSDLITFTRASGGGITNAAGQFEWVGNNVPRITYDPVTLKRLGQLIEEQRTNLRTNSANAGLWGKNSANLNATITAFAAPKSGEFLWETTDGGSGDDFFAHYGSVPNDSLPYTASIFVKKTTGVLNACALGIVFSGGTLTAGFVALDTNTGEVLTASTVVSASAEDFGGLWRLIITVANNASGNVTVTQRFYPAYKLNAAPGETRDNAVTGSVNVWGSQLELGATATTYIPTTTAQVTRAADVAAVNTLSPWYNPLEGTLVIVANTGAGATPHYASFLTSTGSSYEGLRAFRQTSIGTDRLIFRDAGGPDVIIDSAAITSKKRAVSYKAGGDVAICADGGAVSKASIAAESTPAITRLFIGSRNGGELLLNGTIASIEYYPSVIDVQQASA